jgi:hypothetical protein
VHLVLVYLLGGMGKGSPPGFAGSFVIGAGVLVGEVPVCVWAWCMLNIDQVVGLGSSINDQFEIEV